MSFKPAVTNRVTARPVQRPSRPACVSHATAMILVRRPAAAPPCDLLDLVSAAALRLTAAMTAAGPMREMMATTGRETILSLRG